MSRIYLAPTDRHRDADDRYHGDALHVNNYELKTEFFDNHVVHAAYHSDASRGKHLVKAVKTWHREGRLGRGGFGTVFLERFETDELRAVKVIEKDMNSRAKIDYRRELIAMAVLAKVRDIKGGESGIVFRPGDWGFPITREEAVVRNGLCTLELLAITSSPHIRYTRQRVKPFTSNSSAPTSRLKLSIRNQREDCSGKHGVSLV